MNFTYESIFQLNQQVANELLDRLVTIMNELRDSPWPLETRLK